MEQEIIELVRLLSLEQQAHVLEIIKQMVNKNSKDVSPTKKCDEDNFVLKCPYCADGGHVEKHGHKKKKQRYMCTECNRTFSDTTNTIMVNSHVSRDNWRCVIKDTINGVSIDHTARKLKLHHDTVFNMRHKVLRGIEKFLESDPVVLKEIAELDETYVPESFKGTKFKDDAPRKPRLHGERASKPGLSDQQICICTGVERNLGPAYAITVNRSSPTTSEIKEAFDGRIANGLIAFTDGAKSYSALEDDNECAVEGISVDEQKQRKVANLNNVNSFHAFIKKRYGQYRGVATKYLNRYNALFSTSFRRREEVIEHLCNSLLYPSPVDYSSTIKDVENKGLVDV